MTYTCDVVELKKAMAEEGINSNVELSRRSGVDRNTLRDILNKKKKPSTDVMYKLVSTLNLTAERAGVIFLSPTYAKRKFWVQK